MTLRKLLTLTLLLAPGQAGAAGPSWRAYVNPRFGVAVDYPGVFTERDRPPDNGDGQGFRTAGGDATLRVFGSYNVDGSSAAQLMQYYQQPGTAYSYSKAASSWFVLSGKRGDRIIYIRCDLGTSEVVGCLELKYPAAASRQWSPWVDRMSRSLRIGPVR